MNSQSSELFFGTFTDDFASVMSLFQNQNC